MKIQRVLKCLGSSGRARRCGASDTHQQEAVQEASAVRWRMVAGVLLAIAVGAAHAAEPVIEVTNGTSLRHFTRAALLANPAVQNIDIVADVAYQRPMHYLAVPLSVLLPAVPEAETLQFTAEDGFVANIPGRFFAGKAQPWLAVEPSDAPWPVLKSGRSAGPFYLVWVHPEQRGITQEQWPYQLARITQVLALPTRYPQIVPQKGAPDAARRGMQVYVQNCAVCHQINGGGDAVVGPDLNQPFSPTEYFNEPFLRKLIRNPASVRTWKNQLMPGFAVDVINDPSLNDLLVYLRQMAAQRP